MLIRESSHTNKIKFIQDIRIHHYSFNKSYIVNFMTLFIFVVNPELITSSATNYNVRINVELFKSFLFRDKYSASPSEWI